MNCQSTSCTILNVPTGSVKLMKFKKVKLSSFLKIQVCKGWKHCDWSWFSEDVTAFAQ